MTVSRVWIQWVQDADIERHVGSQRSPNTRSCEDRHHQYGRIRVRWHRGERSFTVCIRPHHTSSSPGMMAWGTIGYTSWSPLDRNDGTLNSCAFAAWGYSKQPLIHKSSRQVGGRGMISRRHLSIHQGVSKLNCIVISMVLKAVMFLPLEVHLSKHQRELEV
ncbi:hypothetical protein TNCV_3275211 [Trichonephila clavipes]|nr:hypothetical protein TNCV_3275211 [Trichonephila clavipes]